MTLFFDRAGPLMRYGDGTLLIEDLNPHVQTKWRMRRGEMLLLGLRCIWAAIRV